MKSRALPFRVLVCAAVLVSPLVAGRADAFAAGAARSFATRDGKLGFAATRGGPDDWQIYTRKPSGGHPRSITGSGWANSGPAWSPDGSEIAFARSAPNGAEYQLAVTNPVGGNLRIVVDSASSGIVLFDRPSWSPDGSALTFQGYDPALGQQIYRVDADGTDLERLTNLPAYAAPEDPAWSPAGGTIAFDAWSSADEDAVTDIYLMDADGSNLRKFTDDKALDFNASFSPDGDELVWSRQDRQIVEEGIDGNGFRVVTASRDFNADPAWAPAGDWIAFVSNRPACDGCVRSYNVFLMTATGADIHPITHTVGVQYLSPTWRRSNRGS